MAGLEINWNIGANKRKREAEAATLAQNLLEKGAEPNAVNIIAQNYIKTGQMQIPAMATKMLPGDTNSPEGRSTRVPFQLDQKKKGLFGFDATSGKFTQQETPQDMTDFEVKSYNQPGTAGQNIFIDQYSGKEIRREPNGTAKNVIVKTGTNPNAGSGRPSFKSPVDATAFNVLTKYNNAIANRDRISEEFKNSAGSAAQHFGIDLVDMENNPATFDELQQQPSFLEKLLGQTPPKAAPKTTPASLKFPKKPGTAPAPQKTPAPQGKPLTPELAQAFFKQAGGDKDKARQLAKDAGYTF